MNITQVNSRVEWMDAARGIGIVLVVLGHVLAGLSAAKLTGVYEASSEKVIRFIYSFHMPVFLVLAGCFASRAVVRSAPVFWRDKILGLMYPYFVWSILQLSVQVAMASYTNQPTHPHELLTIIYQPVMQFWFLYVLFLGFVFFRLVSRLGGQSFAFLAASLGLSALLTLAGSAPTSLPGRVRDFLPFFALGACLSTLIQRWDLLPTWGLMAIAILGFGFSAIPWNAIEGSRILMLLLLPLPGTAAVFALAALLIRHRMTFGLRYLGRLSLEIYLAHVIAYAGTRILLMRVFGVTSLTVQILFGLAAGLLGPLLLVWLARWLRFPYLFRWPSK